MRAFTVEPPGGWNHAAVRERPLTERRSGCALVSVCAVGLNPADDHQIAGTYPGGPAAPFVPGRDAAGRILEADDAGRWTPGTDVVVLQSSTTDLAHGMLSEQQWVSTDNLAPLPAGWTLAEGAAAPLTYLTAYKCLVGPAPFTSGQSVLVTGASGGVGIASVQLALALGGTVIALSRSAAKRERLRGLGVAHVFDPSDPGLKPALRSATGRRGVDVVVETVGGPSLSQAVHWLDERGRVSVVGVRAGVEGAIPIPALMFKRASLHGVLVTEDQPAVAQTNWRTIVALLQAHHHLPVIDSRFPLTETAAAFERLRTDVFGKVVIDVAAPA